MTKRAMRKFSAHPMAITLTLGSLLFGAVSLSYAFAPVGNPLNASQEPCAFSVQLKKSVEVRRQYLVNLDQITGASRLAVSDVENMYANITPASYVAGSDEFSQPDVISNFGAKKVASAVGMDSFSADCLACHDGVAASAVGVTLKNDPNKRGGTLSSFESDHPIGMDYNSYVAARRGGYKPIMAGTTKMLFVNGRVGCLSCHDPLNDEKGHLVMSDRNSALCTTCHNK